MNKCTILLSYIEDWTPEFIREECAGADLIICADGGQVIARACGILPDIVIGDFDSTGEFERFDCPYITYPVEKDLTDTEACLDHALEQGYNGILVLGGIGGRLDHTLGNLSLLIRYDAPGRRILFADPKNQVSLLTESTVRLQRDPRFRFFSLVSVNDKAEGVSITGAKYELHDAELPRATTLGISNEVSGSAAEITVRKGSVYIIRSSDH